MDVFWRLLGALYGSFCVSWVRSAPRLRSTAAWARAAATKQVACVRTARGNLSTLGKSYRRLGACRDRAGRGPDRCRIGPSFLEVSSELRRPYGVCLGTSFRARSVVVEPTLGPVLRRKAVRAPDRTTNKQNSPSAWALNSVMLACCAIYVDRYMWCDLCGAISAVQSMWCNMCTAIYVVHI